MRRILLFLLLFLFVAGMGGFGGEEENKLPKTPENFAVSLVDTEGYTVRLTEVSIADNIYLSGTIGKGRHAINFDEIKKIEFDQIDEKSVKANITLTDGSKINLILNGKSKLKGKSKYGIYTIALKDIKEINFLGKTSQKK